ncbi:hypothetical protein NCCP1664_17770 [Zafaria cholistanensis]|uniref:Uncharacterized protein n=1 Tax=Zafaria cholistanensis TaxID=1682741 RepID=A0A5A7NU39_9MICC|nr:hypothetical protein NCCP1664_17770 [Zafaria cholistanensis]
MRQELALCLAELLCRHRHLDRQERRFYWKMLQTQLRYLARRGFDGESLEFLEPRFPGWMAQLNNASHYGDLNPARREPHGRQEQDGRHHAASGIAGDSRRSAGAARHTGYVGSGVEDQFLGNFRDHWRMHSSGH